VSRGIRPPDRDLQRPVVATRPPHRREGPPAGGERRVGPAGVPGPAPRLVTAPQRRRARCGPVPSAIRQSTVERPARIARGRPRVRRQKAREQPSAARTRRRPGSVGHLRTAVRGQGDGRIAGGATGACRSVRGRAPASRSWPDAGDSSAAPQSRPESKAVAPTPGAPASPAKTPEVSRPSAERSQARPPRSRPDRAAPGRAEAPSAATRPAIPQSRPEPKVAAPVPAQPPAARKEVPPSRDANCRASRRIAFRRIGPRGRRRAG